jgi:histidinol-phosphate phosphatase family protein
VNDQQARASAEGIAPEHELIRPALFVGLEGTLVDECQFGSATGPIQHRRGAREALTTLAQAGFCIVVVANQSGLALGRFSRWEFSLREAQLQQDMQSVGVHLGAFVICPHAPGADGRPACWCRLPAPGLLVRAARSRGLDIERSWIVGSTCAEMEAGRRAGCRSALLRAESGDARRTAAPRNGLVLGQAPGQPCTGWEQLAHEILAQRRQVQALP